MTCTVAPLLRDVRSLVEDSLPTLLGCRYDIRWKADGSPVTEADLLLERRIASLLDQHLPGLSLIGEESFLEGAAPATQQGWVAVLDPIDGTENFCSGLKEWGVSLSLWHEGEHAGSLLMLPELGESLTSGDSIVRVPSRITGYSSSMHPAILSGMARAEKRGSSAAPSIIYSMWRAAPSLGSSIRRAPARGTFSRA